MQYKELLEATKGLSWQETLESFSSIEGVVFSTSFSLEDQVITDYIVSNKLNIEIFTIDTGRLFEETYKVWSETLKKYDIKIKTYYPQCEALEGFVTTNGVNAFYNTKELRLECCNIRKVEPLNRALKNQKIWISGLRKEHSNDRLEKQHLEHDNSLNIIKYYPLLDVDLKNIWNIIKNNNIPYNALYKSGFNSIGCAPCTKSGEGRSGRWWWEEGHKECGIHIVNGKIIRN
ncbi:MAG: phosphoadenosine phosphosulfate reductase [Candidatus Deianiraeaceae bacterium]|jgi:phosphoadenosine phosphosulfate reductase